MCTPVTLVTEHVTILYCDILEGLLWIRPEYIASDADGVEALPGPLASLLHCLHWRHEHNVQPGRVLDINISWGV